MFEAGNSLIEDKASAADSLVQGGGTHIGSCCQGP
jgi:hypothetical protein